MLQTLKSDKTKRHWRGKSNTVAKLDENIIGRVVVELSISKSTILTLEEPLSCEGTQGL